MRLFAYLRAPMMPKKLADYYWASKRLVSVRGLMLSASGGDDDAILAEKTRRIEICGAGRT